MGKEDMEDHKSRLQNVQQNSSTWEALALALVETLDFDRYACLR